MAYADDTATLVKAIKLIEEELKNAVSATENLATNSASLANDIDSLSGAGKAAVTAGLKALRDDRARLRDAAWTILEPIFAQIARTIDSPTVDGERLTDPERFFRDWRAYQDGAPDEYVGGRAVTYAAEPAGAAAGWLRRLTVGRGGAGDKIESGRHNYTVTARVVRKPGAWRAVTALQGTEGPIDALDYRTAPAPSAEVEIEHINENNPGLLGSASNMVGNADTTDNAAVTVMTGWTLATTAGSPTLLIEKTTAKLWRGRSYVFSISGASSTKTFDIRLPSTAQENAFTPVLVMAPFYLNAGWAGTITLEWGSKTQSWTEADLTAGQWVNLVIDRDADCYPVNFDETEANVKLTIATGAGAGTNELAFACEGRVLGAYLMTSGSNLLADPA